MLLLTPGRFFDRFSPKDGKWSAKVAVLPCACTSWAVVQVMKKFSALVE